MFKTQQIFSIPFLVTQQYSSMPQMFKQQIQELSNYLRTLLIEGLDITALFIIKAKLSTIKNSIKPSTLMLTLFSKLQLKKMLAFSKQYFEKLRRRSSRRIQLDKISSGATVTMKSYALQHRLTEMEFGRSTIKDIKTVSEQINNSFEQWNQIMTKTISMSVKLAQLSEYHCSLYDQDHFFREQLQDFLELNELQLNQKQISKINIFNHDCSEDQDIRQIDKYLKVSQIVAFFQYVLIWCNQIQHQITDFTILIDLLDCQESSRASDFVDYRYTKTIYQYPSKKITQEQGVVFNSKISSKHNDKTVTQISQLNPKDNQDQNSSLYTMNDPFSPMRSDRIVSDFDLTKCKKRSRKVQIAALRTQKQCQKCLIF